MKGQRRGDALAFLQVLEEECWEDVLAQPLENAEELEQVEEEIRRELHKVRAEQVAGS